MNHYDDMSNTVANTPQSSSESRMCIDELLDKLLIDTPPSSPPFEQQNSTGDASSAASSSSNNPSAKNIMDGFANQMNDFLSGKTSTSTNHSPTNNTDYYQEIKSSFEKYELERVQIDQRREFECIEAFIFDEQRRTLQQRKAERKLQASEEIKMAAVSIMCISVL